MVKDLMRPPGQPDPEAGVVENVMNTDTDANIVVVEVRFVPDDIPMFRRSFVSQAAANEFMASCQKDPNAMGSPLQADAKRAKLLRVDVNTLQSHQVVTSVVKTVAPEDFQGGDAIATEDEVDTFDPEAEVDVDESGLEADEAEQGDDLDEEGNVIEEQES